MKPFTQQEQQRIEDAVAQAERSTSGEIVPLIVPRADDYSASTCRAGALIALAATTVTTWWQPQLNYWEIALLLLGSYLLTTFILRTVPPLLRYVIGADEIKYRVEEKALASFVRHGLHHTRDATGILLLVCLFEKRVQVLADRGINAKVDQQQWDEVVDIITSGLKNNTACDGLCTAIEKCGQLLAPNFPIRDDDTNELPNLIQE